MCLIVLLQVSNKYYLFKHIIHFIPLCCGMSRKMFLLYDNTSSSFASFLFFPVTLHWYSKKKIKNSACHVTKKPQSPPSFFHSYVWNSFISDCYKAMNNYICNFFNSFMSQSFHTSPGELTVTTETIHIKISTLMSFCYF